MSELSFLFARFDGPWRLARTSTALASRAVLAKAEAQATFTPEPNATQRFLYKETGTMQPADTKTPLDFFRHYTYALIGEEIHVLYGDGPQTGQLYQRLIFDASRNRLVSKEEHICAADRYSSVYMFRDNDHFTLETTVRGPRKNYLLRTQFSREA